MTGPPRLLSLGSVFAGLPTCGVLGCLLLAAGGCSSGLSPSQRVASELSAIGQTAATTFPFAGKVLVDGLPPQSTSPDERIVVVLFDRAQPKLSANNRPHAECNPRGEFAFTTYGGGDGVKPGEYVVVIAKLTREKGHNYSGPDKLQNLYSDPDKNEKNPEFTVKHTAAKSDYVFDLKVAGQEPVTTPGPLAVTQIGQRTD